MPSLLAAILSCFLFAASPAVAQRSTDPPVPGEQIELLLGLHRENDYVVAMMKWAGCFPLEPGKDSASGRGIRIYFEENRVSGISLTVRSSNEPRWQRTLPLGLEYLTKSSSLNGSSAWRRDLGSFSFTAERTRAIGPRQLTGFRAEAIFNSLEQLLYVRVFVNPRDYWNQFIAVMQELVPVSQFKAGDWLGRLGSDIATDNGSQLAAWAGVPISNTEGHHAGLHLKLADQRWIDSISFDSQYKGELPFGLSHPVTEEQLAAVLGDASRDSAQSSVARWTLTFPRHWPFHFELDTGVEHGPLLTLRCERQQVQTWNELMLAVGPPSQGVVQDILKLWNVARTAPQTLLGRVETTRGLLGEVRFWHSTYCIQDVIGGTISEQGIGLSSEYRTMEFLLRSYPSSTKIQAKDQLDDFAKALSVPLGETWILSREEENDSMQGALVWAAEGQEILVLTMEAELRVEARATESGSELVLRIRTPL